MPVPLARPCPIVVERGLVLAPRLPIAELLPCLPARAAAATLGHGARVS
ncbi:MAG: hypothetical protein MUC82_16080 [Cypionkella sp.]|nr:hypothetical protein [Cypionkella sp.]